MAPATLEDVLHVRGVGEAIFAHLTPQEACAAACVSRRCNALACAPALYACLSFERLTPKRDGTPRVVSDAVLATLCRRAGASLRFLDIRTASCSRITPAGLKAALRGVNRSELQLRSFFRGVKPLWRPGKNGNEARFVYRAHIFCFNKRLTLGIFATADEAARAVDAHALRLGWPTARLNFPSENVAAAPL
jgi:hypothetical protein